MTDERFWQLANMDADSFIKWSMNKDNDAEHRAWMQMGNVLEKIEKDRLDLNQFQNVSADDLMKICGAHCKKGSSGVLPNGRMSPYGMAITDILFELHNEKLIYESTLRMIDDTEFKGRRDIEGIEKTPTEYAECGCCIEYGGHTTVTFKGGLTLEFGNGGTLLDKKAKSGFFKWLKL